MVCSQRNNLNVRIRGKFWKESGIRQAPTWHSTSTGQKEEAKSIHSHDWWKGVLHGLLQGELDLLIEEDEGLSHYRTFDKPPAFLFLWSISPTCEESAVLSKVKYRQLFRVVPDSRDQQLGTASHCCRTCSLPGSAMLGTMHCPDGARLPSEIN